MLHRCTVTSSSRPDAVGACEPTRRRTFCTAGFGDITKTTAAAPLRAGTASATGAAAAAAKGGAATDSTATGSHTAGSVAAAAAGAAADDTVRERASNADAAAAAAAAAAAVARWLSTDAVCDCTAQLTAALLWLRWALPPKSLDYIPAKFQWMCFHRHRLPKTKLGQIPCFPPCPQHARAPEPRRWTQAAKHPHHHLPS